MPLSRLDSLGTPWNKWGSFSIYLAPFLVWAVEPDLASDAALGIFLWDEAFAQRFGRILDSDRLWTVHFHSGCMTHPIYHRACDGHFRDSLCLYRSVL